MTVESTTTPTTTPTIVPRRPWVRWLRTHLSVVDQLREDRQAHDGDVTTPGFQAVASARIGAWVDVGEAPRWARVPADLVSRAGYLVCRNVYGIELPRTVALGRRVRIAHQSGIVIHPHATIGDDCVIRQNVTLGAGSGKPETFRRQAPRIGNGVSIGAGCAIVGGVRVGDGANLGPNTTIMTNVPEGATVVDQQPRVLRIPTVR